MPAWLKWVVRTTRRLVFVAAAIVAAVVVAAGALLLHMLPDDPPPAPASAATSSPATPECGRVAAGFASAFFTRDGTDVQWVTAVAPWVSADLADVLDTIDRSRIPDVHPVGVRVTSQEGSCDVDVKVDDGGILPVVVDRDPAGEWRVSSWG